MLMCSYCVYFGYPTGTVIVDLNSTDCDSGQNGNVTYSIVTGDLPVLHS